MWEIAKLILCQIAIFEKPPNIIAAKYSRFTVCDNNDVTPLSSTPIAPNRGKRISKIRLPFDSPSSDISNNQSSVYCSILPSIIEQDKQVSVSSKPSSSPITKEAKPVSDHAYAAPPTKVHHKSKSGTKSTQKLLMPSPDHMYDAHVTFDQNINDSAILTDIVTEATSLIVGGNVQLEQCLNQRDQEYISSCVDKPVKNLAQDILSIPALRDAVTHQLAIQLYTSVQGMKNRKHGDRSSLMTKTHDHMRTFSWDDVIGEMANKMPALLKCCMAVMRHPGDANNRSKLARVLPHLGMVYAILVQTSVHDLSRVQRVLTAVLQDSICDQKVMDINNFTILVINLS